MCAFPPVPTSRTSDAGRNAMPIDSPSTLVRPRTTGSTFMNFGAGLPKVAMGLTALWLVAGLASAGAAPPDDAGAPPRPEWTVEQLVARLKEQREPVVAFQEKTYSSLLTEPLIVRGVLRFSPPATLEKEIREPMRERYLIDGNQVLFENAKKGIK